MDNRTLASRIDYLPAELVVWHDGPAALPRLLAMAVLERLKEADRLRQSSEAGLPPRPEPRNNTNHADRWRHAVASLISWHSVHGTTQETPVPAVTQGPPPRNKSAARRARRLIPRSASVTWRDYHDAIRLASDWWELDPIRVGLRNGDMYIDSSSGRHVRIVNKRRADIEVLDIVLAGVTTLPKSALPQTREVSAAPGFGEDKVDALTRWLQGQALPPGHLKHSHGGTGMGPRHPNAVRVVNTMPSSLRNEAWVAVERSLIAQNATISPDTDLGGITLAAARTCYAYLISQLNINHVAGVLLGTPELFLWGVRSDHLAAALSNRVTQSDARAFIDLCTYSPGRSPVSAPLVIHDEQVIIPYELVSAIAFERTLLRAASASPQTSGRLGNVLGDRALRWRDRLATIPGCVVASGVRIRNSHGGSAGDLDIIVWDRSADQLLIVEAKWPVDAATLAESNKVDATFDKGRAQIQRIRAGLADGSITVEWPAGWEGPTASTTIHWWVGSAQQLDSRARPDEDITTTSLRLIENLLPAQSLDDLLTRLAEFPLPREGVEFELVTQRVDVGDTVVGYNAIQMSGAPPAPPEHRRTHLGWT